MQTSTSIDSHMAFAAVGECASERIRVMLVDDERDVRIGLRMLLGLEADLNVVGEAEDGVSALLLAQQLMPDVVVMDVHMPLMDGIQTTRALRATLPASNVVLLTLFDGEQVRSEAQSAGARAYLTKTAAVQPLLDAVRNAAEKNVPTQA